jgi:hypothetical protein
MKINIKLVSVFVFAVFLFSSQNIFSQSSLKLQYRPVANNGAVVTDNSGNGYNATLVNSAAIRDVGTYKVIDLGAANGYVDMGANTGTLIASLQDFSVSVNIYINPATAITGAGNFVWAFSTSAACSQTSGKYLAFRVNAQRYALSTGGWGSEVVAIQRGSAATKGTWTNITYTQSGNTGTIYVDGIATTSSTSVNYKPTNVGATTYNWLGRPPFSGDAYLKNTLIYDFRVYEGALTANEVATIAAELPALNQAESAQEVADIINGIVINNGETDVHTDLELPVSFGTGVAVSWSSSNPAVISSGGEVTRPANGQSAQAVTLTVTVTKNGITQTRTFNLNVLPQITDAQSIAADMAYVAEHWDGDCLRNKINLPTKGVEGSVITWQSSDLEYVDNAGNILKLSPKGSGTQTVTLTATFVKGDVTLTATYTVCIAEDEGYVAYLFAYFTGNTGNEEAIRFAISLDGFHYTALNNNLPIIASDTIAQMNAIRDPHILRGEDGVFRMVVTDMKSANGWSSNHGIVLLKSDDLVNWTHAAVDIATRFPSFSTVNRAWAPQAIYNPAVGQYMVYWSMRSGNNKDVIYYSYANADFTDLTTTPQILFDFPTSTIDGDIVQKDGEYHLFFKTEGSGNGIKQLVSNNLTSGYVLYDQYLQQTTDAVEGGCVFKLINQDKYVLIYDVYGAGRYEFTESDDLYHFTKVNDISMNFTPRHGTIIPITAEEAANLVQKWGNSLTMEIITAKSKDIRMNYWIKDEAKKEIFLPVKRGTDLSSFNPEFTAMYGINISPNTPQNFENGDTVVYTLTLNDRQKTYKVTAAVSNNPVLEGFYADPQILYSQKTNKFYLYPTSDGFASWGGYYFKAFSSDNLVEWTDEGTILNMQKGDVAWADGNAWAPAIVEKLVDGQYKYFYYFSGNPVAGGGKQIGVAVADDPAGTFVAQPTAMITTSPTGSGQQIDPCVFTDPVSGKSYIYWGNGYLAGAELNDDMTSIKTSTIRTLTPAGGSLSTFAYREGAYVFYRNGKYYFMWSVDDTGAANYHVAYGTATSPLGTITVAASPIVIIQNAAKKIYGTGHNSVIQIPNTDEWYIVYHRINANYRNNEPGYHREVCIDKLEFNADGSIKATAPTREGIEAVTLPVSSVESYKKKDNSALILYPNPTNHSITIENQAGNTATIFDNTGKTLIQTAIISDKQQIDLKLLSKGFYIVSVSNKTESLYAKIIKE